MKSASVGQHATLAIHSVKDAKLSKTAAAREEHVLSSRSLMRVKEAVEESDMAQQTTTTPATLQLHQTEARDVGPDQHTEQTEAQLEGTVHRPYSEDSTAPPTLLGNRPAGGRDSPLRREKTDRRHDIWQCSSQAGSPFRAVAGSQSSGGLAQGQTSSSHSGDSDQCDSPR